MDTHLRSVVKGISWRVLATMVTTIVVFLYSGYAEIVGLHYACPERKAQHT